MIYFCADLDNTLIYSYKHDIGADKILVEVMDEKELSYMTASAYDTLERISAAACVVPLTTRSLNQYRRISFGNAVNIRYALAANGGILLQNGQLQTDWYRETRSIVAAADHELAAAALLLQADEDIIFEIRKVDELFIFTKSKDSPKTVARLKEKLDLDKVYVDYNGVKVYVFPKVLNKGASLMRFRKRMQDEGIFLAAGDSEFDIPMLLAADYGFCPSGLLAEPPEQIRVYSKQHFTQEMLSDVLMQINKFTAKK